MTLGQEALTLSAQDLVQGFTELGAAPGRILMAHSSLSSFGWVVGGADTVIGALLQAVSPGGTVCLPTLSQRDGERRFETWDIDTSPSDVGRITEVFRLRPDSIRSDHPTHSVAAIGPHAAHIASGHADAYGRPGPWGHKAFGHGSPWDKFYQLDVLYCFLGVNFRVNTMRHYIQSRLVEDLITASPDPDAAAEDVRGWRKPGVWPDYEGPLMQESLTRRGLIKSVHIGAATCYSLSARAMVDNALEILRAEPTAWFQPEFLEWYERHAQPAGRE